MGAILVAASIYVVVEAAQRRDCRIECLPVALIVFALLFDMLVALGRSRFLITEAELSRYTMGNLLLLIAIVTFGWRKLPKPAAPGLVVLVALQLAFATSFGFSQAGNLKATLQTEARIAYNTDLVPANERFCYGLNALFRYTLPVLSPSFINDLKKQQLTIFSPGPFLVYRAEGPPIVRSCQKAP